MKMPNLFGKRLELRNLNKASKKELQDMFEYSKNPLFYKHMEYLPHKSIKETRAYLKKLVKRSRQKTAHYWFIVLKEEQKVIGSFGVLNIDERKGSAEIGYGLSPSYWGKGYFNESLTMVMEYLFRRKNFYRISAITAKNNLSSINALKKFGFKKEGLMRDYYLSYQKEGRRFDALLLSILRDDWIFKK